MASSEGYLRYVLGQLDGVPDVSFRRMMGEYVLYASGKVFGGIYDDRLLAKPTPVARRLMGDAAEQLPYEGARPMLAVDPDDPELLSALIEAMLPELPRPRRR
ncbi:MAG: TfoX/Sxy family protein [Atopobiaceae bacterium]|jgi:TfoX/Sxy family transcriptional regulator of competence genes|nr:TfoX/Sxy family protein [Atopobiaceae bacterium]